MTIKNLVWGLLGSVVLVSAALAQANKAVGAEQAVAALEQQWLQSQKTNNTDLLAPLLADNVVDTFSDGRVLAGKAAVLADAKATKWATVEYTDVKITVFGDTAVAIGSFSEKGTDAGGKPFADRGRYTDTWVKMPVGRWQCVASHASQVKM